MFRSSPLPVLLRTASLVLALSLVPACSAPDEPSASKDSPMPATTRNSIMVITPYWYSGTWVFDDEAVGLRREPFVAGIPEMINHFVKDIPTAKSGFRLTFSAAPFPGHQAKAVWVRPESGGNIYRLENPPMEGWLCPALLHYFENPPKELYVRADPKLD